MNLVRIRHWAAFRDDETTLRRVSARRRISGPKESLRSYAARAEEVVVAGVGESAERDGFGRGHGPGDVDRDTECVQFTVTPVATPLVQLVEIEFEEDLTSDRCQRSKYVSPNRVGVVCAERTQEFREIWMRNINLAISPANQRRSIVFKVLKF